MTDSTLAFSIIDYLHSLQTNSDFSDKTEEISKGIEALQKVFDVKYDAESFEQHSLAPHGLSDIFDAGKESLNAKLYSEVSEEAKSNPKFQPFLDTVTERGFFNGTEEGSIEYLKRYAQLVSKFHEKVLANAEPSKAELEKLAEEAKLKGNAAIAAKDYEGAIKFYTEAINYSSDGPNSHVYYSNRSAAYCHVNKYEDAVNDCNSCLALSPDYVKAYSRLGLAYFYLEKYQEAVDAYQRAAELEPDNKATQDSLKQATNKLKKVKQQKQAVPAADTAGAGVPGIDRLMGNPNMKKALDQMGGPAGLASLMKDPQMMAMAQQMMKDPAMMQQAMAMLGGGGGGLPDMSALSGLMGGLGGDGAASGGDVPSSSSSKNAKKPFKGFDD